MSLIHVQDLARLMLVCADTEDSVGALFEPDDGAPNGMTHREFSAALGRALDRPNHAVAAPKFLVKLAARADRLVRGKNAKLTPDRARYFCHPDWTASERRKPSPDLWKPAISSHEGLKETAAWYREKGWLR
jgi:nucleoside-diphosphate-sugar epimerase